MPVSGVLLYCIQVHLVRLKIVVKVQPTDVEIVNVSVAIRSAVPFALAASAASEHPARSLIRSDL